MKTRRIPIDFKAVADESGLTRGKLCHHKIFGWGVQNTYGDKDAPDFGCVTPPEAQAEEVLEIDGNDWLFSSE